MDNGRIKLWRDMMSWWWERCNHLFGAGLGTFELFGPSVQRTKHTLDQKYFIWMHSDWLQIVFEIGFIGLIVSVWTYSAALKHSLDRGPMFPSLVGFGIMMCGNYPLHLPVHAFVGALLISMAFSKNDGRQNKNPHV